MQESLDYINKSVCTLLALRGIQDEQVIKNLHILQEAINKANKYDELQKVYFKNEPMESADLNGVKLQELYDFNSKLQEKEKPKKMNKTKQHSWIKNEDGEIDNWQYFCGEYHNGPECEICSYGFCHHCKNEYNDETCDEHYICDCGKHLKGNEKYCPECGQRIRSDEQ